MKKPRFVVHKHQARKLHFDFRLESDGVLKSWAVPQGMPMDKSVKRLAVQVEDHLLDFINFEGTIPKGEYGAGTVTVWDTGTYELLKKTDKTIEVYLHGKKIFGKYVLLILKDENWLLFKTQNSQKSHHS